MPAGHREVLDRAVFADYRAQHHWALDACKFRGHRVNRLHAVNEIAFHHARDTRRPSHRLGRRRRHYSRDSNRLDYAIRIAPTVTRGMQGGPEGAEILAFGAPSNENADAQMVRDFWPE